MVGVYPAGPYHIVKGVKALLPCHEIREMAALRLCHLHYAWRKARESAS
jgi:hypothetical protein